MLSIVKRILDISGQYRKKMIAAIVLSFFEGIFTLAPVILVMLVIYKITTDNIARSDVALMSLLIVGAVLLRMLFRRIIDGLQEGSGYNIFAEERLRMGEHVKRMPMGYFTGDGGGEIMSTLTSDLTFIEQNGTKNITVIVNAYVSMILSTLIMFIWDWRIGLLAVITYIFGNLVLKRFNTVNKKQAEKRQRGIAKFVGATIEYVKGISVIKAFNVKHSEKINQAFEDVKNNAIEFETKFARGLGMFQNCFALGIASMIFLVSTLGVWGYMPQHFVLILVIYAFQIFSGFIAISTTAGLARITEAGLDRYDKIMAMTPLDEGGKDVTLESFDIAFNHVTFAYEKQDVLTDINIKVPEKSMTALVGKSGCGKSTITNLIARFWDVQQGEVLIGGVNVKDMTYDSLLQHISMVFQNVYLFSDTILNNIKFGKPDATMEEVIEACKKARCYDFIMALENGFDTVVIEGGSSLSGGEKQRISIARAILKDAPIILLDEATANVDPDNEKHIQDAINELVQNKTLVLIAHKLSTIKKADQIIVLDEGRIAEQGTHKQLINNKKYYHSFWKRRQKSRGWKIVKV